MKIVVLSMLLLAFPLLNSCSKDEVYTPESKDVTYEASFKEIEGDADLILKGEYIDRTGKRISIDTVLPFKMELKDVPLNIKTGFKGYIFSIKATELVGTIKMTVKEMPGERVSYDNISEINFITNNPLGFSGKMLKEKTAFDFFENNTTITTYGKGRR